jgi:Arc/MetJ-type ribon-helix-helix transcriptional regulator
MKKPISATIDRKLVEWVNSQLKDNLKYRNKSHLIEVAIQLLKKEEDIKR